MRLDLKLFIEGTLGQKLIDVNLVDTSGNVLETKEDVVLPIDGKVSIDFEFNAIGTEFYPYVEQYQDGGLLTTSGMPLVCAEYVEYDFTISQGQAYNNNQKEIAPNVFAMYCGDFNNDRSIDNSDAPMLSAQMSKYDFEQNEQASVYALVPYEIGAPEPRPRN